MIRSLSLATLAFVSLAACASPTTSDEAEPSAEALSSAIGEADGADGAAKSTVTYDGKLDVRGTSYTIELAITYSNVSTSKLVEENNGLKDLRVTGIRKPHVTTNLAVKDSAGQIVAQTGNKASTITLGGIRSSAAVTALERGQPFLALSGAVSAPGLTADLAGTRVALAASFYGDAEVNIQLFGIQASYRPLSQPQVVAHHFLDDPSNFVDGVKVTVEKGELSFQFPRTLGFTADIGADDRSASGPSIANDVAVELTAR
jgi:hypothetical protein